jgi:hypothetical protein
MRPRIRKNKRMSYKVDNSMEGKKLQWPNSGHTSLGPCTAGGLFAARKQDIVHEFDCGYFCSLGDA